MRPEKTTRPKFVCTVTFILLVFVCACESMCVCVCVLILQYHRVCEPLTVSKKEGCNLHFCALVQEQQQIKKTHA